MAQKHNTSAKTQRTRYTVYGLTIDSDFRFTSRLVRARNAPELCFTTVLDSQNAESRKMELVYASRQTTANAESRYYVFKTAELVLLRYTDIANFYLGPDTILYETPDAPDHALIETHFLGPTLSLWLEQQGKHVFHAAATNIDDQCIAFLATNRAGKSSLTASFMQTGHALLTDDVLAVEREYDVFSVAPGYPQMRMWPDQAQHFLSNFDTLKRIHPRGTKRRVPVGTPGFGHFSDQKKNLSCIYLPERRHDSKDCSVEIKHVSKTDAVIELVKNSFVAHPVLEALGLQGRRLKFLARLVDNVPMRRITYPDGLHHLPQVREAILNDLRR